VDLVPGLPWRPGEQPAQVEGVADAVRVAGAVGQGVALTGDQPVDVRPTRRFRRVRAPVRHSRSSLAGSSRLRARIRALPGRRRAMRTGPLMKAVLPLIDGS